jgi:regulator of vacuolar morphogenesis
MEPITSISIPITSSIASIVRPVILYHISVAYSNGTTVTICKRYSELYEFHLNLIKEVLNDQVPVPFPPKSFLPVLDTIAIMDRQNKLQNYFSGLLYSKDCRWRRSSSWIQFLNIPKECIVSESQHDKYNLIHPSNPDSVPLDMNSWIAEYSKSADLVISIREAIVERDKYAGSSSGVAASQVAANNAKKSVRILKQYFERLQEALERHSTDKTWVQSWIDDQTFGGSFSSSSQNVGEGELARRRDLLKNMKNDIDALEHKLESASTASSFAVQRDELLTGSRRKFGVAQETDKTRPLNESQLLSLQSQIMNQQDEALDALSGVIKRQKQIGMAINQELDYHNQLLDDLEDGVNRTKSGLKAGDKKLNRILKK